MNELNLPQFPFDYVIALREYPNKVSLQWIISPLFKENTPWRFQPQINYDGDPNNWRNLGDEVEDTFFVEREVEQKQIKNIIPIFRVILKAENEYISPQAVSLPIKLALYTQGILRRLKLQRTFMPQRRGVLLRRKTAGTRCAKCTDQFTNQSQQSQCSICYGTGIVGGYWKIASPNVLMLNEEQILTSLSQLGHIDPGKRVALFIGLPTPLPADIWVDDMTHRRYRVRHISVTCNIFDFPIVCQAELGLLPSKDIIYSFK